MIETLKGKQSLKAAELQDGDIVCFQRVHERKSRLGLGENKSSEEANKASEAFDDARDYYDFLVNKKTVKFHAHPSKCDLTAYPPFEMVLNSKMSYDKLSETIGERLGVEPTHLRFYTVNATSGNPRIAVKRGPNQTLGSILAPTGYGQLNMNQRNDALYFEVLDMSLAEMDTKKNIKLTYLSEGITKEVRYLTFPSSRMIASQDANPLSLPLLQDNYDILVTKSGNVDDLIQALVAKAKLPSEEEGGKIRIYEASNHKFFRELDRNYPVISINDYTNVIAERIPEEELDIGDSNALISVFHFQGEPSRAHGMPFRFLLKEVLYDASCLSALYHCIY